MGSFFALAGVEAHCTNRDHLFRSGLNLARRLRHQVPADRVTTEASCAALFARQNGSGGNIQRDAETGTWLLATGSWFHSGTFGPGDESRLLQRYLAVGGLQLAQELEGFFSIVIGDGQTKETLVITDIIGSCHCFVRAFPHAVALSGSSLLLAGLDHSEIDPIACQEFLHTGVVYEDRTLFINVRKLEPASVYWFRDGVLKKRDRYWSFSSLQPDSLDGDLAVRRLWDCLTRAAGLVSRTFPYPVCDLTGGYDSRATLAAFLAVGRKCATTVSGPGANPDVTISQDIARSFQLPHVHLGPCEDRSLDDIKNCLAITDGEYDLVEYSRVWRNHLTLSKQFDISINGSFGELARGYWWELLIPHAGECRRLDADRIGRSRYGVSRLPSSLFLSEVRVDLRSHFIRIIEHNNAELFRTPNTFQMDSAYVGLRMQRWQGRIASSTNQLWPCLSPFMFRSVLEVMLQTRSSQRKRSLMIRRMLAEFQPKLAAFRLEPGYPALPVSWTNWYRFHPLLAHYGGKIFERAKPTLLGMKTRSPVAATTPRLRLWDEEEIGSLFDPARMKSASLFEARELKLFLSDSRNANFCFDTEWNRLLSLEYAVHEVDRVRRCELVAQPD